MARRVLKLGFWLWPLWLPAPLAAQDGADTATAGRACFERLDYPCAIELLSAALQAETDPDPDRRIALYTMLAESQLAIGQRAAAIDAFAQILRLQPAFQIVTPGTSPKITDALEQARNRLSQAAGPSDAAPPPTALSGIELGLGGGIEVLIGEDGRALETGPAFDLDCSFPVGGRLRAGVGLRYTLHELAAGGTTLQLAGGWAFLGGRLQAGRFLFALEGGVGVTRFGIWADEGKTGLLLPVRLHAGYALADRLQIGLALSPSWVVTLAPAQSSWTFIAAADLRVAL